MEGDHFRSSNLKYILLAKARSIYPGWAQQFNVKLLSKIQSEGLLDELTADGLSVPSFRDLRLIRITVQSKDRHHAIQQSLKALRQFTYIADLSTGQNAVRTSDLYEKCIVAPPQSKGLVVNLAHGLMGPEHKLRFPGDSAKIVNLLNSSKTFYAISDAYFGSIFSATEGYKHALLSMIRAVDYFFSFIEDVFDSFKYNDFDFAYMGAALLVLDDFREMYREVYQEIMKSNKTLSRQGKSLGADYVHEGIYSDRSDHVAFGGAKATPESQGVPPNSHSGSYV